MERESFEDAETAALHERALRQRQGRPRGAPRRRRDLHGGGAGDHRPGRLADDRLPRPRRRARSTAAPTSRPSRATGMPSFRMVLEAVVDAVERPARRDPRAGAAQIARAARRGRRGSSPPTEPLERDGARRGGRRGCAARSTRSTAASAARPSSRPPRRSSCCSRRGETRDGARARSTRWRPAASTTSSAAASPATRSTRAWLVPHFEKMLYDNALLARAYLHGWQVLGRRALPRAVCEETLDWVLRELRGPEGGFYSALDADSEGEEGRFYVWTPDEMREVLGDDADAAIAWFYGVTERGQLRGRATSSTSPAAPAAEPDGLDAMRAGAATRRARERGPAGPRRQAPDLLERADDRRAGRGRRRARSATTTSTPPARCAEFVLGRAARRRRPPAAHLQGRRRRASTPTSRTTPSCSRRCSTLYEATFEPRWFERGPRAGRRDDRALRRPRARRLLLDLGRPRGADRPPQGDRRPPDPLRQLRAPRSACCASPR